jgi:hypothetical protein
LARAAETPGLKAEKQEIKLFFVIDPLVGPWDAKLKRSRNQFMVHFWA